VRAAYRENGAAVFADGAANIGVRPTFNDRQGRLLEIHLLDRSVDLYGRRLCCQLIERLRGEKAFVDVELLKTQMAKDCEDTKAVLAKTPLVTHI
jgi:riboflavin kinase/FMN adenylyltransferase